MEIGDKFVKQCSAKNYAFLTISIFFMFLYKEEERESLRRYYVKVVAGKQYLYQSFFHGIIKMSTFPKANHD